MNFIKKLLGLQQQINITTYENEFKEWYKKLQEDEALKKTILSHLVTKYSETLYQMIPDGMIAYLFETSLYKGYLFAEYFIYRKKYVENKKINHITKAQSIITEIRLYELEEQYSNLNELPLDKQYKNTTKIMQDKIDSYFHKIVENDNGSYEHVIVEESRKEIQATSKYYMLLGIFFRFSELKVEYTDFPKETNIDILKDNFFDDNINFNNLHKYITEGYNDG
jgi:hypothetical protein